MAFNPMEHMMDLKGKMYLQVMWRLVWFREEHPDWNIDTKMVDLNKETQTAVFRTAIIDADGRQMSTGYGSECVKDFRDYIEKAETKSVGRALAMLGYGTQFAPELDEEARIVDSPVAPQAPKKPYKKAPAAHPDDAPKEVFYATDDQLKKIQELAQSKGIMATEIMQRYKIEALNFLTVDMAEHCIRSLEKTTGRQ